MVPTSARTSTQLSSFAMPVLDRILGHVAAGQVRQAHALRPLRAGTGRECRPHANARPGRHCPRPMSLATDKPHVGRDLFGLAEIGARDLFQVRTRRVRRCPDSAACGTPWSTVSARIPLPRSSSGAVAPCRAAAVEPILVVARIGAHRARRAEIDDQHVDGSVGLGLEDELAVEFQRGAEEHGQTRSPRPEAAPPLRDSHAGRGYRRGSARAARRGRARRAPRPRRARRRRRRQSRYHRAWPRAQPRASPPSRHQARIAFCACSRFSASSKTTECGPSITASVTSSPRWAGRQCMKSASGLAFVHQRFIDLIGHEDVVAAGALFLAHRDPGVGDDAVGILRPPPRDPSSGRRARPRGLAQSTIARARLAAFRRGDIQAETEARGGLDHRVEHVVAVARPGEQPVARRSRDAPRRS